MSDQRPDPFQEDDEIEDSGEGLLPGVDLQLGDDDEISGGDDLAALDEANLYGNDVIVDDEIEEIEDEPGPENLAPSVEDES
jgi:hypothetical protein